MVVNERRLEVVISSKESVSQTNRQQETGSIVKSTVNGFESCFQEFLIVL